MCDTVPVGTWWQWLRLWMWNACIQRRQGLSSFFWLLNLPHIGGNRHPFIFTKTHINSKCPFLTAARNDFCVNAPMSVTSKHLLLLFCHFSSFRRLQAASLWARSPRCSGHKPCSSWRRSVEAFRRCSRTTTKSLEVLTYILMYPHVMLDGNMFS